MDIRTTRECNSFNLKGLANYLEVDLEELMFYYREALDDQEFLGHVNSRIGEVKEKWGFDKGIFAMKSISSIDWFAFERVLIYVLIRLLKPKMVLETGVYYGGNSAFALLALRRNNLGTLVSIDYPDYDIRLAGDSSFRHPLVGDTEYYDPRLRPGFMIPEYLKEAWQLIEGDSVKVIPTLDGEFDLYIHDSDHSMKFLTSELSAAWKKLSKKAAIVVDDIDWSNAFYAFCVEHRMYPFLMTDNGKDDLRVRTGLIVREHKKNGNNQFT